MSERSFAEAPLGILRHAGGERKERHCHNRPFAAVVLSGGYQEAGDEGRWSVSAGDVILHRAFESHVDRFEQRGAQVLILNLPRKLRAANTMVGHIADPDLIVRLALRSRHTAELALGELFVASPRGNLDWPDLLAEQLRRQVRLVLSEWAEKMGLRPETISRGFRSAYGCTPKAYRAAVRARAAYSHIRNGTVPLTNIAHELQFADQAHMSRAVAELTGAPPSRWRFTSSGFKTAQADIA